jgi:hypothetical protein
MSACWSCVRKLHYDSVVEVISPSFPPPLSMGLLGGVRVVDCFVKLLFLKER